MSHAVDAVLDAIESVLKAGVSAVDERVFCLPVHQLRDNDMPCLVVQNVADELVEAIPAAPRNERRRLSFSVFCLVQASTGLRTTVGALRADVERSLLGSSSGATLGGIARRGLQFKSATLEFDQDSLQKPCGGWRIEFDCIYHLRTDAPETTS